MARFNRIHAICASTRAGHTPPQACLLCPAWEKLDGFTVQRGCYGVARELYNIARFGDPWSNGRFKQTRKGIARWRARFNKYAEKTPVLTKVKELILCIANIVGCRAVILAPITVGWRRSK